MKKARIIFLALIFFTVATAANAELQQPTATITASPSVVYPCDMIIVLYRMDQNPNGILLYFWDVDNNARISGIQEYTRYGTSGQLGFFAPKKPGHYTIRMIEAGSTEPISESNIIEVKEFNTTISVTRMDSGEAVFQTGELMFVQIRGSAQYMDCRLYIVNNETNEEVPGYSRTVRSKDVNLGLLAPNVPGQYVYKIVDDTNNLMGTSNVFTVKEPQPEEPPQPEPKPPQPEPKPPQPEPKPPQPEPKLEPQPVKQVLTYDFDQVQVDFAAEFIVSPVSVEGNNWFTEIAGGTDKPLTILYGKVELIKTGYHITTPDEFIKISGENGSQRFLANSMTTGWYDEAQGTYKSLQYIKTLFWSAKKLIGNTVIKDPNPPVYSVILKKYFDENQKLTSITLFFSDEGNQANAQFWLPIDPGENVYQADMSTLIYEGDPTAR